MNNKKWQVELYEAKGQTPLLHKEMDFADVIKFIKLNKAVDMIIRVISNSIASHEEINMLIQYGAQRN